MFERDESGVFTMIAIIVGITLVFAVAGVLAASLASTPQPAQPFAGTFACYDGDKLAEVGMKYGPMVNTDNIIVAHTGGPPLEGALENAPLGPDWNNLKMKINGVVVGNTAGIDLSANISAIDNDMYPGDSVQVYLTAYDLEKGDSVTLVYVPQDQILYSWTVGPSSFDEGEG